MKCEECNFCKYDNSIKEFVCSIEPDLPVISKDSENNCQKAVAIVKDGEKERMHIYPKYTMCDFCEKNQSIKNISPTNHYQFSLPTFSGTLVISDKKRNREYLYGIAYCPICGRKVT